MIIGEFEEELEIIPDHEPIQKAPTEHEEQMPPPAEDRREEPTWAS